MEQLTIPIYTLKQIIEEKGLNPNNPNILILDIDKKDFDKIEFNYPSRAICMGIMVVTKGSASINIDSQLIEMKEMDVINMFPNNVLEFTYFSSDCCIKTVLVSPEFISQLNFQINSQEAFDILSNNYSKTISLSKEIFEIIIFHIERLHFLNNTNTDNFFNLEILKINLMSIIYEIANFRKTQTNSHNFKSSRKEDISIQFIKLVTQNFQNHRNVQYYADKMHISRKYLTRTIKAVFHHTPKQIIEDKIIAEVKMLLLKNDLNINQIMTELNFEDQSVFSKFFKKKTGHTPSSYRQKKVK